MMKSETVTGVEPVFQTLAVRDPGKLAVVVGSAAIAAHLAEAAAPVCNYSDVDVLCSRDFFDETCGQSAGLPSVSTFRVRHSGTTPRTRMLSPVLDIYPAEEAEGILPFSATEALGGTWYPTYYQDCTPERVHYYQGYRFLQLAQVLVWTAASGREKDIRKINTLLPVAHEYGLISDEEYARVAAERDISVGLRTKYPSRYYARVPGS